MKYLLSVTLFSIIVGLAVAPYSPSMFRASVGIVQADEPTAGASATLKQPSQTMEEAIGKAKHWEIIMKIWTLESSQGKNPSQICLAGGQTNELGYGITKTSHFCYDSYDDIVGVVDDWLTRKLEVYSLEKTLCLYQSGEAVNDCGYYRKYKLLD